MEDQNKLIEEAYRDEIITYDNQSLNYRCVLCNKPMTGEAPLTQHLKSNKHKEFAFRYAISLGRDCPESLKNLLTPEIERAVEDGVIETSWMPGSLSGIRCKACNKDLNGFTPLTQHLSGSDHRKQLYGPQLRMPSFVTGANANRAEEPRDVTSPLTPSWVERDIKLPPSLTPTCTGAISSTTPPPIPTLSFRSDNKWQTPNGTSLLEPSYPRLPEPLGLYRTQPPQRETSPIRFPTPSSPVQPVNLLAYTTKNFSKRVESTEATYSSPLSRQTLPQISQRAHNLDPSNSIVLQAVNDHVLIHDSDTLMYVCQVCKVPLTTQQTEDHLKHKSHREASARVVVLHPGRSPPSLLELLPRVIIEAATASIITVTDTNGFKCIICNSFSNGVIPLKQHLEGADHLKRKDTSSEQPTLPHLSNAYSRRMENSTQVEPYGNSHSRDDVDEEMLVAAFKSGMVFCTDNSISEYKCDVCKVSLNGMKNLKQHLGGSKHMKKFQKLIFDQPPESPLSTDDPDRFGERPPQVQPYSVNSNPRGFVYIFNYKFVGRDLDPKERRGAEQDTINLLKTFSDMGYEVFPYENLTARQTRDALEEIRHNRDLERVDALIMFFLSHGKEPYRFYAEDREIIDLQQDVWSKFTNPMCPFMKNKPKIIFANYCRGMYSELKDEFDTVKEKDIPRDLVTIHASTEGITARRNPQSGTHFVRSLCMALKHFARQHDLRKIYEELDPISKGLGGTQPKWEDNRFKTFYFNPINPIMS